MSNLWFQLAAILAIYGALFYLWYALRTRRGIGAWLRKQAEHREMRIVENLGISARTSLILVEARGQHVLVAVSPQGVQMLPLPEAKGAPVLNGAHPATPASLPANHRTSLPASRRS